MLGVLGFWGSPTDGDGEMMINEDEMILNDENDVNDVDNDQFTMNNVNRQIENEQINENVDEYCDAIDENGLVNDDDLDDDEIDYTD